jgi:hypothetical protein
MDIPSHPKICKRHPFQPSPDKYFIIECQISYTKIKIRKIYRATFDVIPSCFTTIIMNEIPYLLA